MEKQDPLVTLYREHFNKLVTSWIEKLFDKHPNDANSFLLGAYKGAADTLIDIFDSIHPKEISPEERQLLFRAMTESLNQSYIQFTQEHPHETN